MFEIYSFVGKADYFILAAAAFWGLYCVTIVWTRVGRKRFKDEREQNAFLDSIEPDLLEANYDAVLQKCEGNERAVPMLVGMAVLNRELESEKLETMVLDRFQFDVIGDIESRISWISTIIKAAPMLGLIGTVAGMMGAFSTLETATTSEPTKQLLADIRMALEHTLIGLLITVTLLVIMAAVNNRIRQLEELVVFGMDRFFDAFRQGIETGELESSRR